MTDREDESELPPIQRFRISAVVEQSGPSFVAKVFVVPAHGPRPVEPAVISTCKFRKQAQREQAMLVIAVGAGIRARGGVVEGVELE